MIRSILLIICMITSQWINSQEPARFLVQGTVSDKESGEPVENVNVTIKGQQKGAITNELGQFKLYVTQLPFTLKFSHISYKSTEKSFDYPPEREIVINLSKDTKPLDEVIITSQKIDTIYRDDVYSVLDYELLEDKIVLLIYKARLTRSELLITDLEGNKNQSLPVLPGKPLALFKDCLGNIHIITKTKVYQIHLGNDQIRIYEGEDIAHFRKVMSGCLFSIQNKLYFERYGIFDFVKQVTYINTTDSSHHDLALIIDREKADMLQNNPEDYSILSGIERYTSLKDLTGTDEQVNPNSKIRHLEFEERFIQMVYYGSINTPVLKLGDSLCIFNHPNNLIDIYNYNDSLVRRTTIDYHLKDKENVLTTLIHSFTPEKKWLEEVYTDPDLGKLYTLFQNINGTEDLMEIDVFTGETKFILTIPFPYVQKIKIKNGFVYFIYKGWGETQKKKLFRQKID